MQGTQFQLNSKDGPIIGRNAEHYSGSLTGDTYHFEGHGKPVVIERPAQGMTLSANDLIADIQSLPDHTNVIKSGSFIGDAKMVSDTDAADAYLASVKQPLPNRASKSKTEVLSARFVYAGTATQGTLTAPAPIDVTAHSSGSKEVTRKSKGVELKGPEDFDQITTIHGAKGTVVFDPQPSAADKQRLRKGEFDGPVTLHMTRSVKGPGDLKAVVNIADGTADHVSFDFTGTERTLTATGHVVLTNNDGVYQQTMNADRAVITLDADLKIVKIDTFGEPASNRLHRVGGVDFQSAVPEDFQSSFGGRLGTESPWALRIGNPHYGGAR